MIRLRPLLGSGGGRQGEGDTRALSCDYEITKTALLVDLCYFDRMGEMALAMI